jgi:two-component sensor histidine kinase
MPPSRRGFGTRLLERGLKQDLRGTITMEYRPEGLIFTIEAPADFGNESGQLPREHHETAKDER